MVWYVRLSDTMFFFHFLFEEKKPAKNSKPVEDEKNSMRSWWRGERKGLGCASGRGLDHFRPSSRK